MSESDVLPTGFEVALSASTHRCTDGRTLYGEAGTIVRLRSAAVARLDAHGAVRVTDRTSRVLARTLLDRGLAAPVWRDAALGGTGDITLVVPVRDRPDGVDRLLAGCAGVPAIVVDDGSRDPAALRVVCERYGARLLRHEHSRGPAAARNTGLAHAATELVAFADSDVVLGADTLELLRRHFVDPQVGLVAPRILGLEPDGGVLHRYEAASSSLDLGAEPALVRPHARVSYVPSAMLLARKSALGNGFDESMQVAEDVDLVWRVSAQWAVRYEPEARVRHEHRVHFDEWFARRMLYGTGAAPLATRHGSAVAPAVLTPWTAAVTAGLLAQRRWSPVLVAGASAVLWCRLRHRFADSDDPAGSATALTKVALRAALEQTASIATRHYVPVFLALAPFSRRARRAYLVSAVAAGLVDHRRKQPKLDPVRFIGLRALDDLAYGLGLWQGVLAERSPRALLPLVKGVRLDVTRRGRSSNRPCRAG
ncbi:mycofactocin biosynthesis glycosyltransferase MftF [Flexivirga caeni]|uniref:mycofactocin biosynthesis glycosyltransferase MftF n=1 Tax=Flexivirga caeni TaxID=2294115 RepID=UPI0013153B8A|nr:mycofactocin biosynthesis glycosyltransferase MftF [Flexivirga caeni]